MQHAVARCVLCYAASSIPTGDARDRHRDRRALLLRVFAGADAARLARDLSVRRSRPIGNCEVDGWLALSATSVAVCVAAAALEGACAGSGVKAVFASLRIPRHSPPLPLWLAIGVVYTRPSVSWCIACCGLAGGDLLARGTLALVLAMMIANAIWISSSFGPETSSLRSSSDAPPRSLTWRS